MDADTKENEPKPQAVAARGDWDEFWLRFRRDRFAIAGAVFILLLVVLAVAGAPLSVVLTGHEPDEQFFNGLDINGIPLSPLSNEVSDDGLTTNPEGEFFILGTDRLGRDVFVRLLFGARISLLVAFAATGVALLIGVPLGLTAGYFRGAWDALVSRGIETALAFPSLLFAIGLAAVIGPGLTNVIVVIALFSWYYPARIVRTSTLALRSEQFVEGGISVGASDRRIVFGHLLPHLTAQIIVYSTGIIATNILFEAGLSYLGLGVPPPTPSWGQMLSDGVVGGLYRVQPWLAVIPGLALALTTLSFNQLGDGMRDAFAPRSAQ